MALRCIDLMIGDWVYLLNGRRKQPVQVIVIGNEASDRKDVGLTVCVYKSDAYPTVIFDIDKIESIPLTPEILEKNEWCSRMNGTGEFYLKKPLVSAAIVTKNIIGFQMNHGPFNGLPIHYVHELQHALRLCGIEKEIVV